MIPKSPNRWSCMPTALAIVLDIPVTDVLRSIGHDGSEVAFPLKDEPERRRGFHLQELIWVCWKLGYWAITFDAWPVIATTKDGTEINWEDVIPAYTQRVAQDRMNELLKSYVNGVICGVTAQGCRHAIARLRFQHICPNKGLLNKLPSDFRISHFLVIGKR